MAGLIPRGPHMGHTGRIKTDWGLFALSQCWAGRSGILKPILGHTPCLVYSD